VQKLGRVLIVLSVATLFALGLVMGVFVAQWTGSKSAPRALSTPAILKEVQGLSELVTVKYVIEKVEVLEVPSENIVGQMLGSENRMLILAHGIVKAGIDLQRVTPADVRINGTRVSIKLPNPQITDAYLDETQTKVIDRKTGLLAPSAKNLEQDTRRNALDSIRRAARQTGILDEADQRARAQLLSLFQQMGFETVEFEP
jgi:hypothetical protein